MKRKIFVIGGDIPYARWMGGRIVDTISQADLVVLTGGADWNPMVYGEPAHKTTFYDNRRDKFEIDMARLAISYGKKLIGICRGGQGLCALAGGKLVQHSNHPAFHSLMTSDGYTPMTTSSHHQMQYPWAVKNWKLLAWTKGLSDFNLSGNGEEMVIGMGTDNTSLPEVEIALYPELNALAIQGHPEWLAEGSSLDYFRSLLDRHMEGEL